MGTFVSFRAFATASIVAVLTFILADGEKARPPNILILLTDDLGWGDPAYNCMDNSTGMCASTPHLDALATDSHTALFHRFYAASAVCSPTRAAILTGRTNSRDCINNALPVR